MHAPKLPLSHMLLALAVAVVWGTNFVVIKFALLHLPPLLLAALRYVFAFLPAAFFLKRPAVPLKVLASYGVLIGACQFGLLYIAMAHSISPGLASIVIQCQVFFTIGLAMIVSKERLRAFQGAALALAAAGLLVIFFNRGGDVTALGLALVVLAAFAWGAGNVIARSAGHVNMLAFVVWASVFAIPPLVVLSLAIEGWHADVDGLANADAPTWAAVLYQSFGNTLFGYGVWGYLLASHPAATVSPFALLVPVVGLAAAALTMHEPMQPWKLEATALIVAGLVLNIAWPRFVARRAAAAQRAT